MKYRFKVEIEKKDSLTLAQDTECEKLIAEWQNKTEMTRLNETVFIKEETDDSDLADACIFARKLAKTPSVFKSIVVYDVVDDEHMVLI